MSAHCVGLTVVSSSNEATVGCSTHPLIGKGMITLLSTCNNHYVC